jgi:hypothetical protein
LLQRLGAAGGVVFLGLMVWSMALYSGPTASPDASDAVVLAELASVGEDAQWSTMVAMFSLPFLIAFGGAVRDRFRRMGVLEWVGSVFLSGTVFFAMSIMLIGGIGQMTASLGGVPGAEAVARVIVVFGWNSSILFIPAMLSIGGTAALATFAGGALPRWVGYGAVLVVVATIASWIGVFVLALWSAATSVFLVSEQHEPAAHIPESVVT